MHQLLLSKNLSYFNVDSIRIINTKDISNSIYTLSIIITHYLDYLFTIVRIYIYII